MTKKKSKTEEQDPTQARERLEHIQAAYAAKKLARDRLLVATAHRKDAADTFSAASAELDRVVGDDEQTLLGLHGTLEDGTEYSCTPS